MTVYFFTKGGMESGSSRQRAFLIAEKLNEIGQKAIVYQPLRKERGLIKKIINFVSFFGKIKKNDILYLQRTIYNRKLLILIICYKLTFRRKIIFDFDDAIYFQHRLRTKILTKIADIVIVGSHSLRDWALKINKNVYIIPTSVDHKLYEKYDALKRPPNDKVVIGWIGNGRDHYKNLALLEPVFECLIADGFDFKFRLIGALKDKRIYELFEGIKNLDIEIVDSLDWSNPENMPKTIQYFDIGLMPLIDDEWHRGKCAFKAIEYMACGVPVVISAVGENNYLVQDGINGFLTVSENDWVEKIKRIIQGDPSFCKKIKLNGKKTILEKYSFEANTGKIKKIIEDLAIL